MDIFKKISSRVLILTSFLIVLNWFYGQFLLENDLQKHSDLINLVREIPHNTDILYVGESSNDTFRGDDKDKRPISEMIGDFYSNLDVNDLTAYASHAGIFDVLIKNIDDEVDIKTLVVTLNIRSFDANWIYSKLETALQKKLVLLKNQPPLYNRFLLSFKGYDVKSERERESQFKEKWSKDKFFIRKDFPYDNVTDWDVAIAQKGIVNEEGNRDEDLTNLACHYVKTYAFQIDTLTNPRIRDFNKIIDYGKSKGWNIIFNLLAENTEKAKELVGEEIPYLMRQNRDLLVNYFSSKGILVIDNLEEVPNEQFIDQNWTTEHYAEKGRQTIATHVALGLKEYHSSDFKSVDFKPKKQSIFSHNLESEKIWGQMATKTKEKSYSGNQASKINSDQPFSLTFENSPEIIPDSTWNYIDISMMVWRSQSDSIPCLVFEALGDSIEYFWKGVSLNELSSTVESWDSINFKFQIPEDFRRADIMKIYVYNPQPHDIYVDDISIKFR